MVRFRRDRWYSIQSNPSHGRVTQPSLSRRLIYMIGMLVLITILMQRASDPRVFEQAFRNLGIPFEPSPSAALERGPTPTSFASQDILQEPDDMGHPALARIWLALLQRANPEATTYLLRATFVQGFDEPLTEPPLRWLQSCQNAVEQWKQDDPNLYDRFHQDWERWKLALERGEIEQLGANDPQELPLRRAWELAIDRASLMLITDAAPWKEMESDVLCRIFQLAKSNFGLTEGVVPPRIAIADLVNQPNLYRGQTIRLRGKLFRAPESKVHSRPGFGEFTYNECWFRPEPNSSQPCVLYAIDAPNWPAETSEMDVEITGLFLKRALYASQGGVDVAPVLICSRVQSVSGLDAGASSANVAPLRQPLLPWDLPDPSFAMLRLIQENLKSTLNKLEQRPIDLASAPQSGAEPGESEVAPSELLQLLLQLERFPDLAPAAILHQRRLGTFSFATLQGTVKRVQVLPVSKEDQEWFGHAQVYRVELAPEANAVAESHIDPLSQTRMTEQDSTQPETRSAPLTYVPSWICINVPKAWIRRSDLNHPTQATGLVIPTSSGTSVMLSRQSQWQGTIDESARPTVPTLLKNLAAAGWDLGNLDLIRSSQKRPMRVEETEPFLSLIRYCREHPSNPPEKQGPSQLHEILAKSDELVLAPTRWRVDLLRITKVVLEQPASRDRLQSDHYYQLDGMGDLGKRSIRFLQSSSQETVLFEGKFPVTIVMAELPAWLDPSSKSRSEPASASVENGTSSNQWECRSQVEIEGLHYRLWEYTSGRLDANKQPLSQISPLLVAQKIVPVVATEKTSMAEQLGWMSLVVMIVIASTAIGLVIVRSRRRK